MILRVYECLSDSKSFCVYRESICSSVVACRLESLILAISSDYCVRIVQV
jgi:hypothetical protein